MSSDTQSLEQQVSARDPRVDPRDDDAVLVEAHEEDGRLIRACTYRVYSRQGDWILYTTDSPAGRGGCRLETWQRMVAHGKVQTGDRRG